MARYIKPNSHHIEHWDGEHPTFGDDEVSRAAITVDGHEPVDTGLVWETGEPIMRLPNPIGFGRDDEW